MANSVDPDQTAPIGAVCSVSTLFACIHKLGNYLQQTTSADDIFRCIFLGALSANRQRVNMKGALAIRRIFSLVDMITKR